MAIHLTAPTLARLHDASSAPCAQASPVVLRAPLRQLLQVGRADHLLRDIRDLRATPVHCRNARYIH